MTLVKGGAEISNQDQFTAARWRRQAGAGRLLRNRAQYLLVIPGSRSREEDLRRGNAPTRWAKIIGKRARQKQKLTPISNSFPEGSKRSLPPAWVAEAESIMMLAKHVETETGKGRDAYAGRPELRAASEAARQA